MKPMLFFLAAYFILLIDLVGQSNHPTQLEYDMFDLVYKTIGTDSIRLDFYQISNNTVPRPMIVWLHGGALIWGSRRSLPKEQLEFYLGAGYSVMSIDYRLAPETKLEQLVTDVEDAIIWSREHAAQLKIDPKRVYVIGHSAGGYLALMTGYRLKNLPQAIVVFYGYGDILGEWYIRPDSFYTCLKPVSEEKALGLIQPSVITHATYNQRFDLYLYCRQQGIWPAMVSGHDPVNEPEYFKPFCPIMNIHDQFPPVLLIHGDHDTDVPFKQSVSMDEALSIHKIDHQFIRMTGFNHAFDIFAGGLGNLQIKTAFDSVITFMNRYPSNDDQDCIQTDDQ